MVKMKKRLHNTIVACLSIPFLLSIMAFLMLVVILLPLFVFIKPDLIKHKQELKPVELRKVDGLPQNGTYGVLYDCGREEAYMWCEDKQSYEHYVSEIKDKNIWDVNKIYFFVNDD